MSVCGGPAILSIFSPVFRMAHIPGAQGAYMASMGRGSFTACFGRQYVAFGSQEFTDEVSDPPALFQGNPLQTRNDNCVCSYSENEFNSILAYY